MLIWKLIFLISFFLIYTQCKTEKLDNILLRYIEEDKNNIIEINPETIQTEFLNNNQAKIFNFSNIANKSKNLLVHIFSINCEIEIHTNENNIIKNINENNDAFLIKINLEKNNNITIKPLINSKNKNIKNKKCPLIINSIFDNVYELKVEEQNPTIFYFNDQLTNINLFYNLRDFTKDKSFVVFQFLFNEKATFEINIDNIKTNQKRIISNSHNVFITEDSIKKLEEIDNILKINLRLVNYTNPCLIYFRVISNKFTPLILQKNYLNHAFITSDWEYQHYFMEISKGEEGEIMLHDKRQNGKLIGKICNKTDIQCLKFENETFEDNYLYKEHIRKLNFTYEETDYCHESCILLITYYHNTFDKIDDTIIGFEFTLLTRVWDKNDWTDTNIVTIPNNEYIFGYFDKDIINHHYYSISVSNEISRIYVEIKGFDIDFFYDEGKRKLNTYNSKITNKFNIDGASMQSILVEKYKGKYLSFTIRPADFLKHPTTFYYFRVFQLRENDKLIMPLDSNVENICALPDKTTIKCNYLLTNNYNEFKLTFSLFANNAILIYDSFNSYKSEKLDMQVDSMNTLIDKYKNLNNTKQNAIYCNNNNNLNYILFSISLIERQITIQNSFYDRKEEIYPQVYSPQIFKIENNTKIKYTFLRNMNFNLIANWIHGEGEIVNFGLVNLEMDVNYMGRPYSILISEINDTIIFKNPKDFVLYLGLKYNANKNIILEEITEYQISNIIQNKSFPFYYYIRNNLDENDSMDLNLKILDFQEMMKNITIEQMFCDEDTLDSLKQGKSINFKTKYKGHYDISSKSGLIQIKNDGKKESITLIKIDGPRNQLNQRILVQMIALILRPNLIDYFYLNSYVPVNQFIAGSITKSKNSAIYILNSDNEEIAEKIIIEFSRNNPGLELDTDTLDIISNKFENGIETFIIDKASIITVQFKESKTPENFTEGNYMFRYYYNTTKFIDYDYEFNKLYNTTINNNNDTEQKDIVRISFNFENLRIINNNESLIKYNIYLSLYINENSDEIFNTLSFNSIKPVAQNVVKSNSSEPDFTIDIDIDTTDLNNYTFITQIKFYLMSYSVNYKILTYSIPMDLTQYLKSPKENGARDNKANKFVLILSITSGILVIIVIIVVIYIIKVKNKNKDLKDKVLSISFSAGQTDSILSDNSNYSKKDEEYENTFI